jgi:NAD+ kinase
MKIAIFGQYYQNDTRPIIRNIFEFFQEKAELIIEKAFLQILFDEKIIEASYPTFSTTAELKEIDLLLSIGGDGTILRAATYVRHLGIPILGINAGRLGFLAKVQKDDIESFLQMVLDRDYTLSQRTLVKLTTIPSHPDIEALNFAFNEITVNRKDTTSMITIETFLNGEYLTSYWADGLIISTPTGSTGYSLSCGGPVITPDASVLVITPIAPHNLNARPLIIPDNTIIELKISGRENQFLTSLDSRIATLDAHTSLRIEKTDFKINMVEIPQESFLRTLRKKLLWGVDRRN